MNRFRAMFVVALLIVGLVPALYLSADEHMAGAKPAEMVTVKGEVLDLACYLDHGAMGDKHASCATTCISSGLPVGLKAADGKVYLVIGEHKSLNAELAPLAGKMISLQGKIVSRDGINMIENAQIVK